MAENGAAEDAQLSFPLPPTLYYSKYTDGNIKANLVPKSPKIVDGEYTMFGHKFKTDDEIIQPLESQGITRLYSKDKNFDRIVEMKKLNHSILVNYLALLDIMIDAPGSPERQKKIEEIKVLFINLHHLINEFRPHQARETLRIMLHRQKQQRLDTAERLRSNIEKARAMLKTCGKNLNELSIPSTSASSTTQPLEENAKKESELTQEEMKDKLTALQHSIMCDIVDKIS